MDTFIKELETNQTTSEVTRIKAFIEWAADSRNLNEELVIAVIDQFSVDSFLEDAENVANNSITGGYDGFTSYTETEAFYKANKENIIQWAKDFNESIGIEKSYLGMLATCGAMESQDFSIDDIAEFIYSNDEYLDNYTLFANGMAWIVGEEICHAYDDFNSEYDEEEDEDDS